ncbi:MAG TPA: hypothetical protein VHK90_01520 [Thermoanaerobaculia bacterium]|nr:hypothetical protein [Thermoanaerobaculia bacterium]
MFVVRCQRIDIISDPVEDGDGLTKRRLVHPRVAAGHVRARRVEGPGDRIERRPVSEQQCDHEFVHTGVAKPCRACRAEIMAAERPHAGCIDRIDEEIMHAREHATGLPRRPHVPILVRLEIPDLIQRPLRNRDMEGVAPLRSSLLHDLGRHVQPCTIKVHPLFLEAEERRAAKHRCNADDHASPIHLAHDGEDLLELLAGECDAVRLPIADVRHLVKPETCHARDRFPLDALLQNTEQEHEFVQDRAGTRTFLLASLPVAKRDRLVDLLRKRVLADDAQEVTRADAIAGDCLVAHLPRVQFEVRFDKTLKRENRRPTLRLNELAEPLLFLHDDFPRVRSRVFFAVWIFRCAADTERVRERALALRQRRTLRAWAPRGVRDGYLDLKRSTLAGDVWVAVAHRLFLFNCSSSRCSSSSNWRDNASGTHAPS